MPEVASTARSPAGRAASEMPAAHVDFLVRNGEDPDHLASLVPDLDAQLGAPSVLALVGR